MKPWELLGEAKTPDGASLQLMRRDVEFVILVDRQSLMTSRTHGSEEALAQLTCTRLKKADAPAVLIGGLGMGYTLRATLDLLPSSASVVVAELMPAVVEWNRGPLGHLANHPMADARVAMDERDVLTVIRANPARFDVILLDVDHSPAEFFTSGNAALYGDTGLFAIRTALKFGGTLAVWSVSEDRKFQQRLRHAGFSVHAERVPARTGQRGPKHTIFIAQNGDA